MGKKFEINNVNKVNDGSNCLKYLLVIGIIIVAVVVLIIFL